MKLSRFSEMRSRLIALEAAMMCLQSTSVVKLRSIVGNGIARSKKTIKNKIKKGRFSNVSVSPLQLIRT